MTELLTLCVVFAAAAAAVLLLPWLATVGRRWPGTAPQAAPFLGGGTPATHAWSRVHARYYTMTLVFIAFEMEMMFMYPWAVVYVAEGVKALAEMGMFLAILALGILYGWREGVFRWQWACGAHRAGALRGGGPGAGVRGDRPRLAPAGGGPAAA